MSKLSFREKDGLVEIGSFKANLEEFCEVCWYAKPYEKGTLYADENGNMVPAVELHITPQSCWDDGGVVLNYVAVIPEENVYEITLK